MNLWNDGNKKIEGIHCEANYTEQVKPENKNNPFIEAIPHRFNVEQFYERLFSEPSFIPEYLELDIEDRLEMVQQIKPSFWIPFPNHFDKYRSIYNMVKIGYQSRNPIEPIYNKQFSVGWDKILKEGLDENGANIVGNIQTAQSLAEIGLSGMGKSKVYERILKTMFPQVIHHKEYKGRKILTTQLVWIKVECPSGKSVGALCRKFYSAVDKVLGSNYYQKYGEKYGTVDVFSERMVKVAAQINLGVLVIDEIQNASKAHSGGDMRIMNFITEIVNTLGVPVIIIGTFKGMYLFKRSLATSRRGIPDAYLENITHLLLEDSWEWNEFIESLWGLQYTKKYTPLTVELKQEIYQQTLGIPDIAIKLFMHVQAKAILNGGEEIITKNLIKEVANTSLRLLQNIFEKIRNGDESALKDLDDVSVDWGEFNDYLKQASHSINLFGKTKKDHSRVYQQRQKQSVMEELMAFTVNLVNDVVLAKSFVEDVYKASNGMGEKQDMFTQIAQLVIQQNESSTKEGEDGSKKVRKSSMKKLKPLLEECDIRFIVNQGYHEGLSVEESLTKAGLITEPDELLAHI